MNREGLIEEIVQEIYKRMLGEEKQVVSKPTLIVMGRLEPDDEWQLEKRYRLASFTEQVAQYEGIVIHELSPQQMARLALGIGESNQELFILRALLEGKKVYLCEKGLMYRRYKDTAPPKLYALYHHYESSLRQAGIRMLKNASELLNPLVKEVIPEGKEKQLHTFNKKVLLEKDLIGKRVGYYDSIEIATTCKITPLAEDFIRTHHLTVIKI